MLFNGLKIQRILKDNLFLLSIILSPQLYAEDFGIAVPGQLSSDQFESDLNKKTEKKDDNGYSYVMGEGNDSLENSSSSEEAFTVPGMGADKEIDAPSEREKLLSTGYEAPQSLENEENLVIFDSEEIYDNFYDRGGSSFSFSYIRDEYLISDDKGVFQKSFINAKDSRRTGYLHFIFDSYMNKAFLSTFYGVGLGVGFSEGEGIFSTSTTSKSNVGFQLFTIPVDFRLGMTIGRGKYFRLSVAGGPSVMGLSQSRDDKDRGDDEKHRRQYSFGYFGHAKAQISISSLFHDIAFGGFSQYQMTNMYLNIEARHQSYESFQDNISITGTSLGVGFTFEYL